LRTLAEPGGKILDLLEREQAKEQRRLPLQDLVKSQKSPTFRLLLRLHRMCQLLFILLRIPPRSLRQTIPL